MRAEKAIVAAGEPACEFIDVTLPDADLVFYFLSPGYPHKENYIKTLKRAYPSARLVGCTTGGEIAGNEALVNTAVSSAVKFKSTKTKIAQTRVGGVGDSYEAGKKLAAELDHPGLRLIFVLSDGLKVNGSELVRGITGHAHGKMILTGGLAGDGTKFVETGVGVDALPETGAVAAIGFYGDKLRVSYGTAGGWVKFGPTRRITRSKGNILYELDGRNALELYKKYLGEEAKNLPGSGLLFPLSIHPENDSTHDIVRTIVGIDEKEQSMIFAGDVPEGYMTQLMRGNFNNLVDGAEQAASLAMENIEGNETFSSLGILVSCIGRNLMMGQHASSEVEAVKRVFKDIPLVGFYSYGEICHHAQTRKCALHNQTMTITVLSEDE